MASRVAAALLRKHAEARVRCSGRVHTVVVKDGSLVLVDHPPELARAESAVYDLGGVPCRCFEVRARFVKVCRGDASGRYLPRPLADVAYAYRTRLTWLRRAGSRRRRAAADPLADLRPAARHWGLVLRLARAALGRSGYRRARKSRWAGGCNFLSVKSVGAAREPVGVVGLVRLVKNGKYTGRDLSLTAHVDPFAWFRDVYRRGLALARDEEGRDVFVAGVDREAGGGRLWAYAGRQARGLAVERRLALVEPVGPCRWRVVRWGALPDYEKGGASG